MSQFKDKLLYESPAISLSEISSILLGHSWKELQEAERWRTPEDPEENKKKVEKAKKAEGIHFIPTKKPEPKILTKKEISLGTAFWELQQWIWIKFPNYSLGSFHAKNYPPREFFRWVAEENIIKELEDLGAAIPERAHHFVGLVEAKKTDDSPATLEEIKSLNEESSKPKEPKQKHAGGAPSPKKNRFIKKLKSLSRRPLFKKILKQTSRNQLPYNKQFLENFIHEPTIEIDEDFIRGLYSEDKFRKVYGTSTRNLVERWIPEALNSRRQK